MPRKFNFVQILLVAAFALPSQTFVTDVTPRHFDLIPNRFLFWMHIQKTSSWMGDAIAFWACPHLSNTVVLQNETLITTNTFRQTIHRCEIRLFDTLENSHGRYGYHFPYTPLLVPQMKYSVVTLFRRPIDRLISAFLFRDGVMLPRGSMYHTFYRNVTINRAAKRFKREIRNAEFPIVAYATHHEIPSCQTKMVLGYHCGSSVHITEEMIEEAKRRVREEFLFVGVTEESWATLQLFHAIFGGQNRGINNSIRRNRKHTPEKHDELVNMLQQHNWSDPADEALYEEASRLFYRRCKMYGISTMRGKEEWQVE